MPEKDLHRRCAALVKELDIPNPFDLTTFCHQLQHYRGRPLRLIPIAVAPDSPCGLWIGTAQADYIFHEAGTTALHRLHIILHEIGHLLLNHRGAPWITEQLHRSLMPDLDPSLVSSMLGRSAYTQTEEQEAEVIATLIAERAQIPAAPPPTNDPDIDAMLARFASAFGPQTRP